MAYICLYTDYVQSFFLHFLNTLLVRVVCLVVRADRLYRLENFRF